MGYKKDVIKGVSWIGGLRAVLRGLSYIRIAIIARILSPSQVGIFGLATVVFALIELITETGINIFLIQRKEEIEKYIDTAWVTSIARGFIIGLVLFLMSPVIASFFNAPDVLLLMRILSITPILRGFINPSIVTFSRELHFHKEFFYRSSIFLVETILSITLLFVFRAPVALVLGLVGGALFEVCVSHLFVKPTPRFAFNREILRQVLHSGKWLTVTGISTYLYQNFDNIVVGKLLGTSALGIYDYAYKLSMLPITEVSDIIVTVTFPMFVKISQDKQRLKIAYLKSLLVVSIVVIPISTILFLFPKEIILFVLGPKWLAGAPVLQVLAILGMVRAIFNTTTSPFYALEKQHLITITSLISLSGLALTIVPFISMWGLVGAGVSAIFGTVLAAPVVLYNAKKLL